MEKQTWKCPVCRKPLTQVEYDKALGIWDEKRAQIEHLEKEQAELKRRTALLKKREVEARRAARLAITEQKRKSAAELKQSKLAIKEAFAKKLEGQVATGVTKAVAKQSREFKKRITEFNHSENKRKQLEHSLGLALEKDRKHQEEIRRLQMQLKKGITPQIEGLLEEDKLLAKLQELFPHDQFQHTGKGGDIIQTVMQESQPVGKIVYECKRVKSYNPAHVKQASDAREFRE